MFDPPETILPHFRQGVVQAGPHGRYQAVLDTAALAFVAQQEFRVRHLERIQQSRRRHAEGVVAIVHAQGTEDLDPVPAAEFLHDRGRIRHVGLEGRSQFLGLPVAHRIRRPLGNAPLMH